MNSSAFSMPARRTAAALTAAALVAGPVVLLGAAPAYATGDHGKAGAVVLRADLDVSLGDRRGDVPLNTSLNEVHAPENAQKTTLAVKLKGVDKGRSVSMLRADVATARAKTDRRKAEGYANLVRAKVHVPGLPLLSLIEVEQMTSKVVCEAGRKPVAESEVLGTVKVLGKKVELAADGTTEVEIPQVGKVRLDLSKTSTTSRTAAATALDLDVSVSPLKGDVAEVEGRVTLVEATCESPRAATAEPETPEPSDPGSDVSTQTGTGKETENLAETGGNAVTPYVAGGAGVLVAAGAGALFLARRRTAAAQQD